MRLPIRNTGKAPLTIFVEPYCDQYEVPIAGEAIVTLEDGAPHSIDLDAEHVTIYVEAGDWKVEVLSESEKSVDNALTLIRVWLYRLDAENAVVLIDDTINRLEKDAGYLGARVQVFEAFHQGFSFSNGQAPLAGETQPEWSGDRILYSSYGAGEIAARLNIAARSKDFGLGKGVGPFDTDTVRSAFVHAATVVKATNITSKQ